MGWSEKDYQKLIKKIRGNPPGRLPRTTGSRRRTTLPPPGGIPPHPGAWSQREWCIEFAPITANKFLRTHFRVKARDLLKWRIALKALDIPGPWHPDRTLDGAYGPAKVRLHIIVLRKKLQDPDNLMASMKNLLDALVREGWLWDDSAEWVETIPEERKAPRLRTVITWRLVGEG